MAQTKTFHLPDLGEGLPDAEIVEWHVKEGDSITLDEPLVSMETAKAVVEVPSPYTGTVRKLHGGPGDVIETGAALAEFELAEGAAQRAEAEDTGHGHGHRPAKGAGAPAPGGDEDDVIASDEGGVIDETDETRERSDAGTVVGAMESSDRVHTERATSVGGVKAVPAVRALAKKLGVELARVRGSGKDGVVTLKDVRAAAESGTASASVPAGSPPPQAGEAANGAIPPWPWTWTSPSAACAATWCGP